MKIFKSEKDAREWLSAEIGVDGVEDTEKYANDFGYVVVGVDAAVSLMLDGQDIHTTLGGWEYFRIQKTII